MTNFYSRAKNDDGLNLKNILILAGVVVAIVILF